MLLTVKVSDWVPAASLRYTKTGINAAIAKKVPKKTFETADDRSG